MSKINTGMQRAGSVTVTKKTGEVVIYNHVYSFLDAFSSYPAINATQLAEMSVADYQARLAAFKTYVDSREIGISLDLAVAYRQNLGSCPI